MGWGGGGGVKPLSFLGEQRRAAPDFPLAAGGRAWGCVYTHERARVESPSLCQSSSCLPEEVRGCPRCVLLSLGSRQQWGRDGGPSVSFKYCSSCVLQSVSHADRTVSMSHTEIMPLAYRNMYSQPCSPPVSAFLSSLLRYVSEHVWSSVVWC